MNEKLIKQWALTEKLLSEAALQVIDSQAFKDFSDFLAHNELGLALEVLEDEGDKREVNAEYWRLLEDAAEIMRLKEKIESLRRKQLLAQENYVHQDIEACDPASNGSST